MSAKQRTIAACLAAAEREARAWAITPPMLASEHAMRLLEAAHTRVLESIARCEKLLEIDE